MRTNALFDSLKYMFGDKSWTTIAFDLLLLAGIAVAILVYRSSPEQRTARHLWIWFARTVMGAMWWQQVIWKTPPTYGGLRFWTSEMVKNNANVMIGFYYIGTNTSALGFLRFPERDDQSGFRP